MNDKTNVDDIPPTDDEIKISLRQWLPFLLSDIHSIKRDHSVELLGYYAIIIAVLWEQCGTACCSITSIKNYCNLRAPKARKVKELLSPYFQEIDGKWHHPWLSARFNQAVRKRIQARDAALAKHNKDKKNDADAYANAINPTVQTHCDKSRDCTVCEVSLDQYAEIKKFVGPLREGGER